MAELAGTTNATFTTCIPTAVAVARGTRVALNASGLVAAAAITVRGDYVADVSAAASEPFAGVSLQQGAKVAVLVNEAVSVADPCYSAASGLCSKTSGASAVLLGIYTQAAASGTLAVVQLENPV
jgi:hypothetical protein